MIPPLDNGSSMTDHLYRRFRSAGEKYPERPALEVGGQVLTYRELDARALSIASTIQANDFSGHPMVAFLAYRSVGAYASVLGILAAGKGYVPLHPQFPAPRTRRMLEFSKAEILIVSTEGLPALHEILCEFNAPLTVICLEPADADDLKSRYPQHRVIANQPGGDVATPAVLPDSVAYLLFTSGSTGTPKGVPISQRNATSYVEYVNRRYRLTPQDRFSQTFDMTFDLSVHDMFVCWSNGACLCSLPQSAVMAPAKFIRSSKLTAWFSVPSVGMFLQRMRLLTPDSFPTLRLSLFCGEPLPSAIASAWQQAAPNSIVDNLYGPTETTIAISHYRWQPGISESESVHGIVPIGTIFSGQDCCVIDSQRGILRRQEAGELCLSGSQVASGYLNNPEKSAEQFVRISGTPPDSVWYRTGDLVRQDQQGCLYYLGRIDNQVQVRGYRVELQEVDHVLREAAGSDLAVAVAWPPDSGHADTLYAFVCGGQRERHYVVAHCKKLLPEYMVPQDVFFIPEMPLNANGKIDRPALTRRLGELLNGQ